MEPSARLARTGLIVAMVASTVVGLVGLGGGTAAAQSNCTEPGGVALPFERQVADDTPGPGSGRLDPARLGAKSDPDSAYDVIFNGGGWGHGIGMSQYGARGAAALGCGHEQILETYYPGADLAAVAGNPPIRVGLYPNSPSGTAVTVLGVQAVGEDDLVWRLDGSPLSDAAQQALAQAPDRTVYLRAENTGGWTFRSGPASDAPRAWPASGTLGEPGSEMTVDLDASLKGTVAALTAKGMEYARGTLEFTLREPVTNTGQMTAVVALDTMQQYLFGLGEVPSSWPAEALATQAVAARSFAAVAARAGGRGGVCRCTVYDSTSDQFYAGWSKEKVAPAWVRAVQATNGEVMVYDQDGDGEPEVVPTYYSSSNGGMSSAASDIWGSDPDSFGYLRAVDTSRWDQVDTNEDGDVDNPYHRWSVGFTDKELATRLGFTTITSITVERAPGGRPCLASSRLNPCEDDDHGFQVTGYLSDGDSQPTVKAYTAEGIRAALGGFPNAADGFFSGLVGVDGQAPPFAPPAVATDRLFGPNRISTAIALSRDGWTGGSTVAVVARSDDPADALAGSGLAGHLDAPLLLTNPAFLSDGVGDELARLGVGRVILLGGSRAISGAVANEIRGAVDGARVGRVAGSDRYATAAEVARRIAPDGADQVLIVRGRSSQPHRAWPDALAVSGLAARRAAAGTPIPILAVDDTLPAATRAAVGELGATRATIAGGTAAVSAAIESTLAGDGLTIRRLGGVDRYGTSRLVAAVDDTTTKRLVLATGTDFPDGLAAGPFAARTDATLLLVPRDLDTSASPWNRGGHGEWLTDLGWPTADVTVVGGTAAIGEAVRDHVADLLRAVARSQS